MWSCFPRMDAWVIGHDAELVDTLGRSGVQVDADVNHLLARLAR